MKPRYFVPIRESAPWLKYFCFYKVGCSGIITGIYSNGQYVNFNITLQQIIENPYFREVEVEELALII